MKCASYQGFAIGLQAGHCREEAARFRQLAQREPLAQMRRFLTRLAAVRGACRCTGAAEVFGQQPCARRTRGLEA